MKIVFAGTPAFGLPCLEAIAASKYSLQAIYTQPDRPAGRGRKLQASAVKQWGVAHNIPVYQPPHFKNPEDVETLATLTPDVMIVIAYGLILPQCILDIPKFGCINVHASLLPRGRGASPIQYTILQGDQKTGITIMQMDAGMDTGPIITQATCPIYPHNTFQDLHDRLAQLATQPLIETLNLLDMGQIPSHPQDNAEATYTGKIHKADAKINWQQPATLIDRKIRAYNPWPVAFAEIDQQINLRIHRAHVTDIPNNPKLPAGTILALDKTGMLVNTGSGTLLIEQFQFPNAKALSVADWLNAHQQTLHVNAVLE